jgi:hypothetical protein
LAGPRGPVPKRSEERRRRNTPKAAEPVKLPLAASEDWPAPDEEWHPIAVRWYRSLAESGQRQFYEPSDVAAAVYVAEAMSRSLRGKMSSVMFAAVMSAMTELLTTEAARRRARVELERVDVAEEPPAVASMAKYRAAAKAPG